MDENRETRTGQHYSYTFKNKRVGDAVAMLILIVFLAFTILVFRFINSGSIIPALLTVALFVFGILFGVYYIFSKRVYRRCTERTEGVVTSDYAEVSTPNIGNQEYRAGNHGYRRVTSSAPVILFRDRTGKEYRCVSTVARQHMDSAAGRKVIVRYDPEHPETNYVEKSGKPLILWIFIGVSVFFVVMAGLWVVGFFMLAAF